MCGAKSFLGDKEVEEVSDGLTWSPAVYVKLST